MIEIEEVKNTQEKISPFIKKTELISSNVSKKLGLDLKLKLELNQPIGAFKIRGAMNAVLNLSDQYKGVTCCSTGNHGKGVAFAAQKQNKKAVICMSENVPMNKVEGIKQLGAEVKIEGASQDEAEEISINLAKTEGLKYISPFDDLDVLNGQATIGLEIFEQDPDIQNVLIPLSGGGLAGGIAAVLKQLNPNIKVYGVSMENGAAMYQSIKDNKPSQVKEFISLADSLQGGIGLSNKYSFKLCQKYLDDIILVSEQEIYKALQEVYYLDNITCEGACVVGIAALMNNKIKNLQGLTSTIITGKNIDLNLHKNIIEGKDIKMGDLTINGSAYV
ncbi:pyridoxal-phosphate dependent enzyme [Candidatus Pelagibacter communis]|uniref:pyridoxal-phosphate dependent enzyme n=1 Tax=Pelagibacter ubique TaxID=198252 RepID=UPI003EE167E9